MNKKEKHLVICLCYIALLTLDSHKNLLKKKQREEIIVYLGG